jgi:hypothetical protein
MSNDLDFENCNVYLKNNNINNSRPYSRKRSAIKYIVDNLEKEKANIASNKDPTNDLFKNLNINDDSNLNNFDSKNPDKNLNMNANVTNCNYYRENKPKIIQSNYINQNLYDKKPEYESRRKKQINFMNCIDSITQEKAYGNTNNVIDIQTQNNFQKYNDNNQSKSNTNNIINGTYESRRVQANYSKSIILKEKEGDNLNKVKKNYNK